MSRLVAFIAGIAVASTVPVGAERVGRVCHDVILPYVASCTKAATLANGYTPAECNRA